MKKKYPKIVPYYSGKKNDPHAKVLLNYDVYVSILDEIKELEARYGKGVKPKKNTRAKSGR